MTIVTLINPWTHQPTKQTMTWEQIVAWAHEHIHEDNIDDWVNEALSAYNANDGATLGRMIIGS